MPGWLQSIDETALRAIAEHLRISALNGLVSGFTNLGNAGALFIVLAVILLVIVMLGERRHHQQLKQA